MNPYTGHIVTIGDDEAMARALQSGHHPLPQELMAAVTAALAGEREVTVNLRAAGPLQDWAKKMRKKKRKEKMAAKSRRINQSR